MTREDWQLQLNAGLLSDASGNLQALLNAWELEVAALKSDVDDLEATIDDMHYQHNP